MINDGVNDVPVNTIAVFTDTSQGFSNERVAGILSSSPKTREWFTPHFYRCLPLVIGNRYGFVVSAEYDFYVHWDGSNEPAGVTLRAPEYEQDTIGEKFPTLYAHFGEGIFTVTPPFVLRTPPGVNLMTINPPNFFHPNFTVMTGVVETDNLRRNFTFNIKLQMPGIETFVPKGTPLAAFIPVPRYYVDGFSISLAEDVFPKEIVAEEMQAMKDAYEYRLDVEPDLKNHIGRHYFRGEDVYGNKFKDHQKN